MTAYMKKVGFLGGTFDPIHLGHLLLAEAARDFFSLERILFSPSGNSYMKECVSPVEVRTALTKRAISDNPHFVLSELESRKGGNTYSSETMQLLAKENPDTQYFFIIGADSLFMIEKWYRPDLLFANCVIAAARREGYAKNNLEVQMMHLQQEFKADIRLFNAVRADISSTEIRTRISEGQSIQYMVPDKVLHDIYANKLYQ